MLEMIGRPVKADIRRRLIPRKRTNFRPLTFVCTWPISDTWPCGVSLWDFLVAC